MSFYLENSQTISISTISEVSQQQTFSAHGTTTSTKVTIQRESFTYQQPLIYTPNYQLMLDQLRDYLVESEKNKINFLIKTHDQVFFYENVEYTERDYKSIWEKITQIFIDTICENVSRETLQEKFFYQVLNGNHQLENGYSYVSLTKNKRWTEEHTKLLLQLVFFTTNDLHLPSTWNDISYHFSIKSGCERSAEQCKRKFSALVQEDQ